MPRATDSNSRTASTSRLPWPQTMTPVLVIILFSLLGPVAGMFGR
jgi:hypothetical protein